MKDLCFDPVSPVPCPSALAGRGVQPGQRQQLIWRVGQGGTPHGRELNWLGHLQPFK